MASRYVALLRGINVGGKNKLPMKELVEIFEGLGCEDVETYIQSGNVVFSATAAQAKGLAGKVSAGIKQAKGIEIPVVLRSAAQMRKLAAKHPLAKRGMDEKKVLHVMFLADKPSAAKVKQLDPERSPGDSYVVQGAEVYSCCPNGVARSKLTNAYFDGVLGTVSTGRNWRTVQTLLGMLG
ncbi:MAG: DUF1697 domain-containing protein [Planctomycetota bacterium]|jgi:uncharacterized protein (DUF1697 family)